MTSFMPASIESIPAMFQVCSFDADYFSCSTLWLGDRKGVQLVKNVVSAVLKGSFSKDLWIMLPHLVWCLENRSDKRVLKAVVAVCPRKQE